MAKTAQDLAKSRRSRKRILAKYGGEIPDTVWHVDWSDDGNIIKYGHTMHDYAKVALAKRVREGTIDPSLKKDFIASFMHFRGGKDAGYSVFPYNILKRAVLLYTGRGDVVLDPCAGHNSRMQGVYQLGRSYVGYDICDKFMAFNRQVAKTIQNGHNNGVFITLHEQTSEWLVEDNDSIDFAFTSPPYWDVEYYGDHPDQLGFRKTYPEFLAAMGRVGTECFRVLKPGKFCVFNVANIRKNGMLYRLPADLSSTFLNVGFESYDEVVMTWPSQPLRSIFATQVERDKKMGKRHEYLLVFRKPTN